MPISTSDLTGKFTGEIKWISRYINCNGTVYSGIILYKNTLSTCRFFRYIPFLEEFVIMVIFLSLIVGNTIFK